jgi:hypothetical protein
MNLVDATGSPLRRERQSKRGGCRSASTSRPLTGEDASDLVHFASFVRTTRARGRKVNSDTAMPDFGLPARGKGEARPDERDYYGSPPAGKTVE